MTTIQKAMKIASQEGDWTVKGKLVCRQIFVKRRDGQTSKLLIEVFVDLDGAVIEVKSWSEKKAYTVFRKFKQDECIEIAASGPVREPNSKYSMAKCEIYARWFLTPIDNFKLRNYIHCVSNIEKYHLSTKKPASVVGLYEQSTVGPKKMSRSGHLIAQGYYVRLMDDMGRSYQVLVWSNVHLDKGKPPLAHCDNNSVVLIIYAREQEERYRRNTPGYYTLTSTYPPVVNPDCVSPHTRANLRRRRQSLDCERCIPYDSEDAG